MPGCITKSTLFLQFKIGKPENIKKKTLSAKLVGMSALQEKSSLLPVGRPDNRQILSRQVGRPECIDPALVARHFHSLDGCFCCPPMQSSVTARKVA